MAHGYPDYGIYTPKKTTYLLQDMAELAVRLGAITTYDRRGDIVWWDDFEPTILRWEAAYTGTGAGVELSTDGARSGSISVKLTTGDAIGNYARIRRYIQFKVSDKIGVEFSFTLASDLSAIQLDLYTYDGAYCRYWRAYFNTDTHELYIRDRDLGDVLLDTYPLIIISNYCWYWLKLVVDASTGKYVRLIFGGREYDLSAYNCYATAGTNYTMVEIFFLITTAVNANRSILIDDAIITQNEP